MGSIEAALEVCNAEEAPVYAAIIRKFNVNHSTLSRCHRGVTAAKLCLREDQSLLTAQQESDLVAYINKLTEHSTPPTNSMVKTFALELSHKRLGKSWLSQFVGHHSNQLTSGFLQTRDKSRKKADNYYEYSRYFNQVCYTSYLLAYTNI
jgi:hypothetical protein